MRELCHRCHGELPDQAANHRQSADDAMLFCPRCGAPQIRLPEHMQTEVAKAPTTGAMPPPRPSEHEARLARSMREVDWHAAVSVATVVAGVATALALIGLAVPPIRFFCVLWILNGSVTATWLYSRQNPRARIDGRVGGRVGVATGLLIVAAMGVMLACTGLAMRFGTHSLADWDAERARAMVDAEARISDMVQMPTQPPDVQRQLHRMFETPEFQAGSEIGDMGLVGGLILLISVGTGAFTGMLRTRRVGLRQGS